MSKIYYSHTSKLEATKNKVAPACTVALQRIGDIFYYGIAICSKKDNFSKAKGREIALARLETSFGSIPVPPNLLNCPNSEACRKMLYQLTDSLVKRNERWKRKLKSFNNFFICNKREKNTVLELA